MLMFKWFFFLIITTLKSSDYVKNCYNAYMELETCEYNKKSAFNHYNK